MTAKKKNNAGPSEEVPRVVECLRNNGVILYPTDTVWGIGCDASREEAVQKVMDIKGRESGKSFIVLIADIEQLHDYVRKVPDIAWDWVEYAEKPLTVVYPEGQNVAPPVLADDGSIAIRLVRDDFCRQVIRKLRRPLVSTSANFSGEATPASFAKVSPALKEKADYVVQWRRNEPAANAAPSKLVRLNLDGTFRFLR